MKKELTNTIIPYVLYITIRTSDQVLVVETESIVLSLLHWGRKSPI